MFNRFASGSELARECWNMLRENKEWLKIPLVSAVGIAVFSLVYGIISFVIYMALSPSAATVRNSSSSSSTSSVLGVVLLFIYYFVTYGIVIYTETALVSVVLMKLNGQKENPTAADGFAISRQRIPAILGFAALSATVGVIARMITDSGRESKNLAMQIIAGLLSTLLQAGWSIMTLMATPVIAMENLGTLPAISRSWALFKQTWGEQVGGRFSLGMLGCVMTLGAMAPGALVAAMGGMVGSPIVLGGGFLLLVVGLAIVSLLTNAAGGIFKAVIYQYATVGNTGGLIDEEKVRAAFAPAK
jgi:hypothetical protein